MTQDYSYDIVRSEVDEMNKLSPSKKAMMVRNQQEDLEQSIQDLSRIIKN
jgi:hypothetical protein